MRRTELLILSSIVGLLTLGAWQGRDWLVRSIPFSTADAAPATNPGVLPTGQDETGKKADKVSPRSHGLTYIAKLPGPAETVDSSSGRESADLPLVALPAKTRVSPLPALAQANFTPGISREALIRDYGSPALNVLSRQQGHLFERYYYATDQDHYIAVTLWDGSVSTSETIAR